MRERDDCLTFRYLDELQWPEVRGPYPSYTFCLDHLLRDVTHGLLWLPFFAPLSDWHEEAASPEAGEVV